MSAPLSNPPPAHSAALSITLVLCTRHRPAELERCIESLDRLRSSGFQILVVENGPADGETRAVAERIPGARYAELDTAHLSNLEATAEFNAELLRFWMS